MRQLSEQDKAKIIQLIQEGKPIPSVFKSLLFEQDDTEFVELTKDYRLYYKGKTSKQEIIANTPSAPLQTIRSFNTDNPFDDGWKNMLIFGDNLLALKAIYEDQQGANRFNTKNRIKLIYIDPPFATKQDFMKDREKAYRDKIIGAEFIEFLRKRLILLREILADDGSIYVHLDYKKGHYIKAILDEIFGEHNFVNEIIWKRTSAHSDAQTFAKVHDVIFLYSKGENPVFHPQIVQYSEKYIKERYRHIDPSGRLFADGDLVATGLKGGGYTYEWNGVTKSWRCPPLTMKRYEKENLLYYTQGGVARLKRYLDEVQGTIPGDVWSDIYPVNSQASERVNYPTQKPESLIERVLRTSSNEGDIIIDVFAGSGSTITVAEKLNRKWIGVDSGKLSVYTIQSRVLNLNSVVGSITKDERREYERIMDFEEHSKSNSRAMWLVFEKARKGDFQITDQFLQDLALFASKYIKGTDTQEFSFMCPEDKFWVKNLEIVENENNDEAKAGEKIITIGRIRFLISFIQPKEKAEKTAPLKAKEFTLFHAGIYDKQLILQMDWSQYKPFVAELFDVRLDSHQIHTFQADGFIGRFPAIIWPYPKHTNLTLDKEYVQTINEAMGGSAGDKMYIIVPIPAISFMEDEIEIGNTTYVFLKVPLSILMALIEKGEPGALRQPVTESDVNEVIDAVGFDFISHPKVEANYYRATPENKDLFNAKTNDFIIEIVDFRSDTLAQDPEDFENFETLSMVMLDLDFNGEYFDLDKVFWSNDILNEGRTNAVIRIPESDFTAERLMVIYMDKYGNELKITKTKNDF